MPSLQPSDMGKSGSGDGWSIPWKVVGAVALITCSAGYGMYQYERFFPPRKTPPARVLAAAASQRAASGTKKKDLKASFEKVGLTDDQRRRLEAIDEQTTSAQAKMRQAAKVLTADQRKQLRDMRAELAEARKEAQLRNQRRQAKYFPNPQDAAYAKAAAQRLREERKAQKKAAEPGTDSAQK